jgi:hypothetical protein
MRKTLLALGFAMGLVAACSSAAATGAPGDSVPKATLSASTAPSAAAPKELDACKLITDGEAAAVLGKAVDPGAPPEPGASSCLWVESTTASSSIEVTVTRVGDFDSTKKSIPGLTFTRVSGIGDDAYYASLGTGSEVLTVKKGQSTFSVSVLLKSLSDSDLQAAEKSLALLILGRI